MGTHSKVLEVKCKCGEYMVEYHKKSPWIDDFASECPVCEPGEAMDRLRSWERRAAREDDSDDVA